MRVVLDTNILVSALITKGTPPDQLYQAWLRNEIELVTSDAQIDEVTDVLANMVQVFCAVTFQIFDSTAPSRSAPSPRPPTMIDFLSCWSFATRCAEGFADRRAKTLARPACATRLRGSSIMPKNSERCPRGRRSTLGKRVWAHTHRGFESLPLRQICLVNICFCCIKLSLIGRVPHLVPHRKPAGRESGRPRLPASLAVPPRWSHKDDRHRAKPRPPASRDGPRLRHPSGDRPRAHQRAIFRSGSCGGRLPH